MRLRAVPLLAALVATACLAACDSGDGRSLAPLDPDPTIAPVTQPPALEVFSLSSVAFSEGGAIPALYTCAGTSISPDMAWASAPQAAELALVVRDLNADGFVHWVITGIDPAAQSFAAGALPEGAQELQNSDGSIGWFAPCPPAGGGEHLYQFVLHAVPDPLDLDADEPAERAAAAVEAASTDQAVLTGTFTR
ncbi:MAG: YbhB/YbcL family Raf kinase inhibitor-like protein [Acidimicrobiales bacterium]